VAAAGLTAALALSAAGQGRRPAVAKVVGAEPRAIVYVDDVKFGRADDSGSFVVTLPSPGTRTVLVRQPGYADSAHQVAFSATRQATVRPKKVPIRDAAELARGRGEAFLADGKNAEAVAEFQAANDARKGGYPRAKVGLARAL
jgi:hypothetical protein